MRLVFGRTTASTQHSLQPSKAERRRDLYLPTHPEDETGRDRRASVCRQRARSSRSRLLAELAQTRKWSFERQECVRACVRSYEACAPSSIAKTALHCISLCTCRRVASSTLNYLVLHRQHHQHQQRPTNNIITGNLATSLLQPAKSLFALTGWAQSHVTPAVG